MFMKTKPIFSLLVSMSVPMMLSMLIQSLYNIVDSIYVSWLGTDALTAVSLAYPLQNAIVSVAVGIGVGISSAISIHLGAGNQEKADRAATIGIGLTVFHCILFILAGLVVTRPFLSLFTDKSAVLEDACAYTYIVLCFSFGSLLQIAFEKIFQGIGQMKITMILLIVGCVVNIILDPILIFGLLGFPELGVAGAAIATVIGQISAFLLYIVVYLRKSYAIHIRGEISPFRPEHHPSDIQCGNPLQHHDAAPIRPHQHTEQYPHRILRSICGGTRRVFQAPDIYLHAG